MTKIWSVPLSLEAVNNRGQNTMVSFLNIVFTEIGDDFMKATMPITERVMQPHGIMHGGASCALAETVGSTAANCCVDFQTTYCVGLDINTNHIRAVSEGIIIATARPYHLGQGTHVWGIEIHNEKHQLISITRLTMAVLKRKK